jgi:hypothetical protein
MTQILISSLENSVCSHLLTLVPGSRIFLPWRLRRYILPKRRFTQNVHGATSQKAAFIIFPAVKTSNLTLVNSFTIFTESDGKQSSHTGHLTEHMGCFFRNIALTSTMVWTSGSQPLWDRGPVNSFFTRGGIGKIDATSRYRTAVRRLKNTGLDRVWTWYLGSCYIIPTKLPKSDNRTLNIMAFRSVYS